MTGMQSIVYLADYFDINSSYVELKLEEESETEKNEETEVESEVYLGSFSVDFIKNKRLNLRVYSNPIVKPGDRYSEVDTPPPEG